MMPDAALIAPLIARLERLEGALRAQNEIIERLSMDITELHKGYATAHEIIGQLKSKLLARADAC